MTYNPGWISVKIDPIKTMAIRFPVNEETRLDSLGLEDKKIVYGEMTSDIVNSPKSHQLILSGPGTGKTTLFGKKIERWNNDGISNNKILITSFINFIIDDLSKNLPTDCKIFTLHKLAKIIIHKYLGTNANFEGSTLTSNFNIAWECDEVNISEDIVTLEELSENPQEIKFSIEEYFQTLLNSKKPGFIRTYLRLVSFYDIITFKDSIVRAYKALLKNPGIFDFEKVIVDEYQDFNHAEQEIIKVFFDLATGGIIAGDDDQSIYSNRKAHPSGISSLVGDGVWEKRSIPFCGRCKSEYVVRSAIEITRKQRNTSRNDKTLLSLEKNGKKIQVIHLKASTSSPNKNKHFLAEAEYIAKMLDLELISSWRKDYPAYLILGKTGTHLKRIADEIKNKLGIDVGMKESSAYDDLEVQTVFSYIQLLSNPKCNIAFRRLLGICNQSEKEKLLKEALLKGGFNNLSKNKFSKEIQRSLENIKNIAKKNEPLEKILWEIVKELKLNSNNPLLKKYIESIKDLASIEKIIKQTEDLVVVEKEKERRAISSQAVQFLTIWSSKGLKAETVFILGLEEGYWPKINRDVEDEEIRLMYVGMTRAVEKLNLIYCSRRYDGVHSTLSGGNGFKNKSVFLGWLSPDNIEERSYTKNEILQL